MACVVRKCKSRMGFKPNQCEIVSFHKFPRKKALQNKWITAVSREIGWIPKPHHRVCSKHFTVDCFDRDDKYRRLKDNAVPTLLLEFKSNFKLATSRNSQSSPGSATSLNSSLSMVATTSSIKTNSSENMHSEHLVIIKMLEMKVHKLEKIATRRLLKINALRQIVRRLKKRNSDINSHLINILREEDIEFDESMICDEYSA